MVILAGLEASWGDLGASWGDLGASWGDLGASWDDLRASWDALGAPRRPPGGAHRFRKPPGSVRQDRLGGVPPPPKAFS